MADEPKVYVTECVRCGRDFAFTAADVFQTPTTIRKAVGPGKGPTVPGVLCPLCKTLYELPGWKP